jgi:hypothetical protein
MAITSVEAECENPETNSTGRPTPSPIDFKPGELLGCVSGELGLRKFLEDAGHTLVVTSSKDGGGYLGPPREISAMRRLIGGGCSRCRTRLFAQIPW